ncbi:hypothetical protein BDV28DRAFT_130404 [Aspergillus coremiiformis]|uniref:Uncharacterized protein n=1 Tax=Aspergillus coremiiformis TaxID=138285 RepID=A0A5N6ZBE1_9EURO|nr:hypothetical protein BDV28DRAFT_130404 [Aspergillus coremiiformis]
MKVTDAFLPTGGHFYGLPFALFDQSLLWYPTSPSRRRQFVNDTIPAWPSWSWASWVGSVDYEVDILHLGGSRFVYPVNEWYRYDLDHSRLVCIPEREPENSPFALGLLYSRIDILRRNPACIIAWVTSFRMTLSSEESHAANWVTDTEQSVPFFTILDHEGDPCGFLPSTNRDWARRFKATGGRECELVSLCYVRQSAGHELGRGGFTFHKKYQAVDNPYVCFYNVILVDYEDGIAYRQGIGRIHQDALRTINHVRKIMILG